MVAQKCRQQHEEKEILLLVSEAANNRPALLTPNAPTALTGYDIRRLESQADSACAAKSFFLEFRVHRQNVGRQMHDGLISSLHVGRLGGLRVGPG
jgi:hypothetical protein